MLLNIKMGDLYSKDLQRTRRTGRKAGGTIEERKEHASFQKGN